MQTPFLPAALLLFTCLHQLSAPAHAQGSLTPPAGPPVASMKTLDQVEARTAIPQSPAVPVAGPHYTISQPGSYYLTGNITVASGDAIVITSDDVSLDLNGFTIKSTFTGGTSGMGIIVSGSRSRLTIRNGSIVSGTTVPASGSAVLAGFKQGIQSDTASTSITQALISQVHVSGIGGTGIYLDFQGVVEHCTVRNCGSIANTRRGSPELHCRKLRADCNHRHRKCYELQRILV